MNSEVPSRMSLPDEHSAGANHSPARMNGDLRTIMLVEDNEINMKVCSKRIVKAKHDTDILNSYWSRSCKNKILHTSPP